MTPQPRPASGEAPLAGIALNAIRWRSRDDNDGKALAQGDRRWLLRYIDRLTQAAPLDVERLREAIDAACPFCEGRLTILMNESNLTPQEGGPEPDYRDCISDLHSENLAESLAAAYAVAPATPPSGDSDPAPCHAHPRSGGIRANSS